MPTITASKPPTKNITALWLGIHFPALGLEIFTRSCDDKLAAVVIQKQRILFGNELAAAAGIKTNSSISTALALSPKLKTFERAPDIEQKQLQNLAQWLYRYSPSVCVKQQNTILIEISGSIRLFEGLNNILRLIANGLKQLGYSFAMDIAHTPKAAELLAQNTKHGSSSASHEQAADQTSSLSKIQTLPLDVLPEPRAAVKLKKMGLETLGEVLQLPSGALRKRFGGEFYSYLQQLSGTQEDPQEFIQTRPYFSSQLFFLEPIENSQGLIFPMQRLLDELCQFLHTRQLHCNQLEWVLHQGASSSNKHGGKHIPLTVHLSQAQANKTNFMNLSRIQLEKLNLTQGAHTLELKVGHLLPASTTTGSLFEGTQQGQNSEPLDSLLDKLQARLGEHSVYCIDCDTEHLPEKAHRHKAVSIKSPPAEPYASKPADNQQLKRPAWLLREPNRIQSRNGALYWRGILELHQGPERIETSWWEQAQQRDYYIARHTTAGGFYWVYQDIPSKQWFLHGFFS